MPEGRKGFAYKIINKDTQDFYYVVIWAHEEIYAEDAAYDHAYMQPQDMPRRWTNVEVELIGGGEKKEQPKPNAYEPQPRPPGGGPILNPL